MQIPIIERRRIEAQLLKIIYDELVTRLGEAVAEEIIAESVRKSAIEQGRQFASAEPDGTSMRTFVKLYDLWTMNDALEIDVLHQDEERFDFNVTRCRYAEMYREMGLGHIGHLLSCNRDGTFCQGYDPNIRLERSQTIMRGASHCDFRYRYERQPSPERRDAMSEDADK
jgi:hypothetical protein